MSNRRRPIMPPLFLVRGNSTMGTFRIVDENFQPRNITGWVIRGGVKEFPGGPVLAKFLCSLYNAEQGIVLYRLSHWDTAALEIEEGVAHFMFLGPAGTPLPLSQGKVIVEGGAPWQLLI